MKPKINLDPVKAIHARLNLWSNHTPALKGAFEVGRYYDPSVGEVVIRQGAMKDFVANSLAPFGEEEAMEVARMYKAAADSAAVGIKDLQLTLNAMRTTQVDSYVRGMGNYIPFFFEEENLLDNERPAFRHSFKSPVSVYYMAEDGSPKQVQAVDPQKEVYPDLRTLVTDEVSYKIRDVYNGNIAEAAQRTFDLAYDMSAQIESIAKTHLDTAFGDFVTTGNEIDRTYVKNSHVLAANLPTTNDITVTGANTTTKFDHKVMIAVRKYCDQWANIFSDGPLSPTGVILVSSSETTQLLEGVNPFGTKINTVGEAVLDNYLAISYANTNWVLVPDVTLAPKVCYPVLNKKLGKVYYKPSQDMEFVLPESPAERFRLNKESRYQHKVIGLAHAEPKRVNVIRVRYTTDS